MSDLTRVHTVEPLAPLSDDDITYRTTMPHWTMTEALFILSGHNPPGYESTRHMQDHFWNTYDQAVRAIEMGEICREIKRVGKRVFIDSPANWFAWADSLGPKHIEVDERVRRAIQKEPGPPDLTVKLRSKGGMAPKFDAGLQQFIDRLFDEFEERGKCLVPSLLKTWLEEKASKNDGYDEDGYNPDPAIPACGDVELYDNLVWWKERQGQQKSASLRTIERYITRAKNRTPGQPS
ncbi:MAG: hypothetical protein IID48_15295 [Proteobacteria bacterium]|nr:hypothetical protein [Pseudomonadota bacterium]